MESIWKYYSVSKRTLSIIGLWPYQKGRRMKRFRLSLMIAILLSLAIPQWIYNFRCPNMQCFMLNFPSCMFPIMGLTKVYMFKFVSSKIKCLTDCLQDDLKTIKDPEECEIIRTYALNTRFLTLTYSISLIISSNLFAILSMMPRVLDLVSPLNESRPIMMATEVDFFLNNEDYYYYILLHTIVSADVILIGIFAHDCTFMTYINHVCSLFAVVGYRLENLSRNDNNDATSPRDWKAYNRKIGDSVYIHCLALRFAELLEETFYINFSIQMLIIVLTLSISLLQIVLQLDDKLATVKCMMYIITQIVHVFLYSLQGQKVIDHSLHIRDKIYNSRWYNIPARSQKLLLQVMQRSLEPSYLSAGKIYVFSLKSFTTVLQSSMSYFTVLASFQ